MAYLLKNDLIQQITEVNSNIIAEFNKDYLKSKFGERKIVYLKYDELVELLEDIKNVLTEFQHNNTKKQFVSSEEGKLIESKRAEIHKLFYDKYIQFKNSVKEEVTNIIMNLLGEDFKVISFNSHSCTIGLVDKEGKDIFGADFNLNLDEQYDEHYNVIDIILKSSMGSIGSFEINSDYAHFLVGVGKFFNNSPISKKARKDVEDCLRKVYNTRRIISDSFNKLSNMKENLYDYKDNYVEVLESLKNDFIL